MDETRRTFTRKTVRVMLRVQGMVRVRVRARARARAEVRVKPRRRRAGNWEGGGWRRRMP